MKDAALAEGILRGTIDFKVFWDEYWDRVYHSAYTMVSDAEEAKDLTICVFTRAWQRMARYDATKGSLWTWLHLITKTVVIAFLRKRKLSTVSLDRLVEKRREPTCDGPEAAHARTELWRAVDELPEPEQTVIELHYHDGYTWAEVARRLGKPIRTVKFHAMRGLVMLQGRL